jgi:hypothetical protein
MQTVDNPRAESAGRHIRAPAYPVAIAITEIVGGKMTVAMAKTVKYARTFCWSAE